MDLAMDIDAFARYCLKDLQPLDEVRRDIVKLLVEVTQLTCAHYQSVQLIADFRIVFTAQCVVIWLLLDTFYRSQHPSTIKTAVEDVRRQILFGALHGKKYAHNLAKWIKQDLSDEKLRDTINNYFHCLPKDQQRWRFVLSAMMSLSNELLESSETVYQQGGYPPESVSRQTAVQGLLKNDIQKKLTAWLPAIERHEKVLRPGSAWRLLCMISTTCGLFAGYSSAAIGYEVNFLIEWGIKIFDAGRKDWIPENAMSEYPYEFTNLVH